MPIWQKTQQFPITFSISSFTTVFGKDCGIHALLK